MKAKYLIILGLSVVGVGIAMFIGAEDYYSSYVAILSRTEKQLLPIVKYGGIFVGLGGFGMFVVGLMNLSNKKV